MKKYEVQYAVDENRTIIYEIEAESEQDVQEMLSDGRFLDYATQKEDRLAWYEERLEEIREVSTPKTQNVREQLDNFEVYRIYYPDEYEHPNDIDLVSSQSIVDYVNDLIPSGDISDETLELFHEKHQHGIQTEEDAVELLEADGYNVCLTKVFTKGK
jgi:hypothetical protein